jgi:hypothetical protein
MNKQRKWTIRRLILMVAAFILGIGLAFGQNGNGNNGNGNNANGNNGNGNHGNADDGNAKVTGCPSGQKNCTKHDQRWQSAINNKNRHAAEVRKNNGKDQGHH